MANFSFRHLGNAEAEQHTMLKTLGYQSLDAFMQDVVPASLLLPKPLQLPEPLSEQAMLAHLREKASKNKVFKNYIGMGYSQTLTPSVILRNMFENPGWYTAYTPYQAEISQGRLEMLLNFQTLILDLTGMDIANASLLDEATAAAEAMLMLFASRPKTEQHKNIFLVAPEVFPQTLAVLQTRALPLGIAVQVQNLNQETDFSHAFGALVQYPNAEGALLDYSRLAEKIHLVVAADILALTVLAPPTFAQVVVGSSQRFGVPMGFGGPHAAFFACKETYKRDLPGRIIGVSLDAHGKPALRMALQTREQHIKRDKATSNICTAQALLANMAAAYAVYHGKEGLQQIAKTVHALAKNLAESAKTLGYVLKHQLFFDTLYLQMPQGALLNTLKEKAEAKAINFYYWNATDFSIQIGEGTTEADIVEIVQVLADVLGKTAPALKTADFALPAQFLRTDDILAHPVFSAHRSETKMMRYLKYLENKDLSLVHSMIPLGSCTMKLNAATELMPLSWAEFANMHPFAPEAQTLGYREILSDLQNLLSEITGFYATSLQPNSGAQGEYAGLRVIQTYFAAKKQHRNICLIPASAHGTNPASAAMCGMKIVVVACDAEGNIDILDLAQKVKEHAENVAVLMLTYPSTHGVYEENVRACIDLAHGVGAQVYMDGANMNAQVAYTSPGFLGADVCHLNLHKTFAIPHGGGGPGAGPICVAKHLADFLPGHPLYAGMQAKPLSAVSAAPFGSALIVLISYSYIRMMGEQGLRWATANAILNANYMRKRLENYYRAMYLGAKGHVAHELLLDLRAMKKETGVEVADIAKRLMDYGFHAPTVAFPLADTLMIEPTESEDKAELDRFCDAMIAIAEEIDHIKKGVYTLQESPLKHAPHTAEELIAEDWQKPYSKKQAFFPLPYLQAQKYWVPVKRVDNAHGDRNLICACPPIEMYQTEN
jgi:glycine dehydrogenase